MPSYQPVDRSNDGNSHWRIQGGAAGARPPPTGSISFVFAYVFVEKCTCRRLAPPQREILDPLLIVVNLMTVEVFTTKLS